MEAYLEHTGIEGTYAAAERSGAADEDDPSTDGRHLRQSVRRRWSVRKRLPGICLSELRDCPDVEDRGKLQSSGGSEADQRRGDQAELQDQWTVGLDGVPGDDGREETVSGGIEDCSQGEPDRS